MLLVRRLQQADLLGTFCCGVEPLDVFLHRFAKQNQAKSLSSTWLAVDGMRIAGYVTVATQSVAAEDLSSIVRGLPRYPAPVLLLARMATDTAYRGHGVGSQLLDEVCRTAVQLADLSGCVGIFTDAKADAVGFYAKQGFQLLREPESPTAPTAMFLPLSGVRARIAAAAVPDR